MSSNTTASPAPAKVPKSSKPTSKKSTAGKAPPAHPSWAVIITECIVHNKDSARSGVSRSVIRKFAEDKYKLEANPSNTVHLNRAISTGAEKGTFVLPKGVSGKVKLAPKSSKVAVASKENAKPASKVAATKKVVAAPKTKTPATKATKAAPAKAPKKILAKAPVKPTKKATPKSVEKKTTAAKSSAVKSTKASSVKTKAAPKPKAKATSSKKKVTA